MRKHCPGAPNCGFAQEALEALQTGPSTSAPAQDGFCVSREYHPGDRFGDCDDCPEMVVVPAGSFLMGSPEHEAGRHVIEGPQCRVTISVPFAVGRFEVTFDQWDACVADGGCGGHDPGDEGWGRGDRPVINVFWNDAKAYLPWLSRETGEAYRLLSEAEWEYAARAGTTTPFYFGPELSTGQANHEACDLGSPAGIGDGRRQTMPVGSYPPNDFALHDVHGNVWGWVEDCWVSSYVDAPGDARAMTSSFCFRRMLRGGYRREGSISLRSVIRGVNFASNRNNMIVFHVVRML